MGFKIRGSSRRNVNYVPNLETDEYAYDFYFISLKQYIKLSAHNTEKMGNSFRMIKKSKAFRQKIGTS